MTTNNQDTEALKMTCNIVAGFVSRTECRPDELPGLIATVHQSVTGIMNGDGKMRGSADPAVPISKSITPAHIICLEDGKKLKMLKRYIRTHYDLSPEEYRRKWGLPADYPMVAPNYAKRRSQFAKDIGLGRLPKKTTKRKTTKSKKAA